MSNGLICRFPEVSSYDRRRNAGRVVIFLHAFSLTSPLVGILWNNPTLGKSVWRIVPRLGFVYLYDRLRFLVIFDRVFLISLKALFLAFAA